MNNSNFVVIWEYEGHLVLAPCVLHSYAVILQEHMEYITGVPARIEMM